MTGEAVKEATWALLGIEVEQVVRPCLFRRFKRIGLTPGLVER